MPDRPICDSVHGLTPAELAQLMIVLVEQIGTVAKQMSAGARAWEHWPDCERRGLDSRARALAGVAMVAAEIASGIREVEREQYEVSLADQRSSADRPTFNANRMSDSQ